MGLIGLKQWPLAAHCRVLIPFVTTREVRDGTTRRLRVTGRRRHGSKNQNKL
jgi:hypothetical protein